MKNKNSRFPALIVNNMLTVDDTVFPQSLGSGQALSDAIVPRGADRYFRRTGTAAGHRDDHVRLQRRFPINGCLGNGAAANAPVAGVCAGLVLQRAPCVGTRGTYASVDL